MKGVRDIFVVYTQEGCPRCAVLKKKLELAGIEYTECSDVDTMLGLGIQSLPMLGVDDKLLTFNEAVKYISER